MLYIALNSITTHNFKECFISVFNHSATRVISNSTMVLWLSPRSYIKHEKCGYIAITVEIMKFSSFILDQQLEFKITRCMPKTILECQNIFAVHGACATTENYLIFFQFQDLSYHTN